MSAALKSLEIPVELLGTCDLTLAGRKFSGNSLRCKREAILYHGTLLYAANIEQIADCLIMPPRQPDYRQQRPHREFLTNLPARRNELIDALRTAWGVSGLLTDWPRERTKALVGERYSQEAWNQSR